MRRKLVYRENEDLHHYKGGIRYKGAHDRLRLVYAGLYGDCTNIFGVVLDLYGDCTGVSGDVTGFKGNFDKCKITEEERGRGINIKDLTKTHIKYRTKKGDKNG